MPTPYMPRRPHRDTVVFESLVAFLSLILIISGFTLYVTRTPLDANRSEQLATAHVHILHTNRDDTVL